jgi:hypothetical protein
MRAVQKCTKKVTGTSNVTANNYWVDDLLSCQVYSTSFANFAILQVVTHKHNFVSEQCNKIVWRSVPITKSFEV